MENNVFARIRQTTGMTQKEFAHAIGVASVGGWEQGTHFPSYASMKKLFAYCRSRKIDCDDVKTVWTKKSRVKKFHAETQDNPFIRIRLMTGLTQKEFAKMIGVRSVVNWERDRCYPNYTAMRKIVRFCEENQIDYTEAQEAWKRRNRTTSRNKCFAQQLRWKRSRSDGDRCEDSIELIRSFIRQCDGDSEIQTGMREAAQQILEILEQKKSS